jgi:hypothetical protein
MKIASNSKATFASRLLFNPFDHRTLFLRHRSSPVELSHFAALNGEFGQRMAGTFFTLTHLGKEPMDVVPACGR